MVNDVIYGNKDNGISGKSKTMLPYADTHGDYPAYVDMGGHMRTFADIERLSMPFVDICGSLQ